MVALMQRLRLAKANPIHVRILGSAPDISSVAPHFYLAAETIHRRPVPKAITLNQIQLKPVPCPVRLPEPQPHDQAAQFLYRNRSRTGRAYKLDRCENKTQLASLRMVS
jgi:hypothetical protein